MGINYSVHLLKTQERSFQNSQEFKNIPQWELYRKYVTYVRTSWAAKWQDMKASFVPSKWKHTHNPP